MDIDLNMPSGVELHAGLDEIYCCALDGLEWIQKASENEVSSEMRLLLAGLNDRLEKIRRRTNVLLGEAEEPTVSSTQ